MTRNLGDIDRAVRIIGGLAAIALINSGPASVLIAVGLYALVTARLGWCVIYAAVGICTRRSER